MPIYWNEFSWESFATLTTGLSAVAGAVWIGLRQAKLAQNQLAIQDRQVALAELTLRSSLFERRWAVYQPTRVFLGAIMREAREPEKKITHDFLIAMNESMFLFAIPVHNNLEVIWKKCCGFFAVRSVMDHSYSTTGSYGSENVEQESIFFDWLGKMARELPMQFGDELRLSSASLNH